MEGSIRVNLDDLLERLKDMKESDYTSVELILDLTSFEDESELKLIAHDMENDRHDEYGTLCSEYID